MGSEATVKSMKTSIHIEYSDGSRQMIPKGCLVYVWVKGESSALEGRLCGFDETEMHLNVMGYGTLSIPFGDITGIHNREE